MDDTCNDTRCWLNDIFRDFAFLLASIYIFFFVKFFSHLPSTLLLVTLCISRGRKCLYVYLSLCYFSPLFFCVYVYVCVRINISLAGSRPLIVRSHVHSLDISHSPTLSLPRPSARVVKQPSLASPFFSFDLLKRALILSFSSIARSHKNYCRERWSRIRDLWMWLIARLRDDDAIESSERALGVRCIYSCLRSTMDSMRMMMFFLLLLLLLPFF